MFVVTALGLVNSGKSALLSALADRPGLFREGEKPGLTHNSQQEMVGPLVLVDTPGFDVDPALDTLARSAIVRADVVLWCHSLEMGELRPTEREVLRRYAPGSGPGWHLCLTLTHADAVATQAITAEVYQAVVDQVQPLSRRFPGRVWFSVVRVHDFWFAPRLAGQRGQRLAEMSGVPGLRAFLWDLAIRSGEE